MTEIFERKGISWQKQAKDLVAKSREAGLTKHACLFNAMNVEDFRKLVREEWDRTAKGEEKKESFKVKLIKKENDAS